MGSSSYYPVDTPPGTKALPLGVPAPGLKGGGAPSKRPPTKGKRKAGTRPPVRKASKR